MLNTFKRLIKPPKKIFRKFARSRSEGYHITEKDAKKIIALGISPSDIQNFVAEKYTKKGDTKELIENLFYGDMEELREQAFAHEVQKRRLEASGSTKLEGGKKPKSG